MLTNISTRHLTPGNSNAQTPALAFSTVLMGEAGPEVELALA